MSIKILASEKLVPLTDESTMSMDMTLDGYPAPTIV